MNCGTALAGEYCTACGQRHEPRVHTLGHFASEAFESITHADSRLWRTLGFLLVKPGRLSREFFDGRRARYLPPFRLYLVISVVFFLLVGIPGGGGDDRTRSTPTTGYEKVDALNKAANDLEAQLGDKPGGTVIVAQMRAEAAQEKARLDGLKAAGADAATLDAESKDRVTVGGCEKIIANPRPPDAGIAYDPMLAFCKKLVHASGREVLTAFVHNIPRAMFVFLPLMALFLKLLYWRPKRYYVEHLLFLVHNHAFVFLAFIIQVALIRLPLNETLSGLLQGALWLYILWYIFRSMRVYYGQSRWLTFSKYFVIGLAYFCTSLPVLALVFAYSAISLGGD